MTKLRFARVLPSRRMKGYGLNRFFGKIVVVDGGLTILYMREIESAGLAGEDYELLHD